MISPWLRRHLPELRVQERVLQGSDLAARHLRLITRRIAALEHDGVPRPALADLLEEVRSGVRMLGAGVENTSALADLHEPLSALARRLTPQLVTPGAPVTEAVIVMLTRPLVMDLLTAAGMPVEDARALLPPI